jgi:hypothetical protein
MDELIQIFNAIPEQGIPWLMNPSERVAVLGILEILKPKKTKHSPKYYFLKVNSITLICFA